MEGGYGQDYNQDRGLGQPSPRSAEPTGDATTAQPERDLQTGNPNLTGAAPAPEKRGIAEKVKGLLGGHSNKQHSHSTGAAADLNHPPAVYGDATEGIGNTDTKVGCLDKIKGKVQGHHHQSSGSSVGSGVGHHPDSSPHGTGAGTATGFSLDPTGPPAGSAFGGEGENGGRHAHGTQGSSNPYGVGAGTASYGAQGAGEAAGYEGRRTESSPYGTGAGPTTNTESYGANTSSDYNDGRHTNMNTGAEPHEHGGWPQPTNPTGRTNAQGGATLTDQHGNLQQGPRDDNVKKEGFMSKIMDKLHSPNGKHTNTATENPTY